MAAGGEANEAERNLVDPVELAEVLAPHHAKPDARTAHHAEEEEGSDGREAQVGELVRELR